MNRYSDDTDLFSLAYSVIFHFLLIIILSKLAFSGDAKRVALITDVTLIDTSEYAGVKGQEKEGVGAAEKQEKLAETVKKKKPPVPKADVTAVKKEPDVKELLARIEREKSKLDIGISREDLKKEAASDAAADDSREETADDFTDSEVVAGSAPVITGALATRRYNRIDWKFPQQLPEETELAIEIIVQPSGVIKSVNLIRTSGYPELDRMALSQARKMQFDPLPAGAAQQENAGILLFKFGAGKK